MAPALRLHSLLLLFIVYIKPLGELILWYGIRYYQYSDETQFYISLAAKVRKRFFLGTQRLQRFGWGTTGFN